MKATEHIREADMDNISRRSFLVRSSSAVLGAGLLMDPKFGPNDLFKERSRVVEVMHQGAVMEKRRIDESIVRDMLRGGMEEFTGSKNPWAGFFNKNDRIGLKINTLGRPLLYTHHELINSVTSELIEFGIKENNIIIWDYPERHMSTADFILNTSEKGIKCYGSFIAGTSPFDDTARFDPDVLFESENDTAERRHENRNYSMISSILTRDCDKIINMPILKHHSITGVTLCLKNIGYGVTNNNTRFHDNPYIGNFIADVNSMPEVRNKIVLNIVDGLEACYENGPVPLDTFHLFTPKKIWISTDPVALDTIGYDIVNNERKRRKFHSLEKGGYAIDHIPVAARKGLGTDDLSMVDIKRVIMD